MSSGSACPSESAFAELAAGMLPDDARQRLEEHVDGCAACTELVGMLGALPDAPLVLQRAVTSDAESPRRLAVPWWYSNHAAIASTMLVVQFHWSILLWLPATRLLIGADYATIPALTVVLAAYTSSVGIVGPFAAVASLTAVRRGYPSAGLLMAIHAMMMIPSLTITPLSLVVLSHLRRKRHPA
jgi:hypothetical protein